jgi:hypothetical protein
MGFDLFRAAERQKDMTRLIVAIPFANAPNDDDKEEEGDDDDDDYYYYYNTPL